MLLLVGIARFAAELPLVGAGDLPAQFESPLVPWACSETLLQAVGDVAALAEHLRAVGVGELDGVVVEDLAEVLAPIADLAAAHAVGLDRMGVLDPVADVEVVDVLLADVVAAEPDEVVPVAHLVLHFGLARAARSRTQTPPPFQ